jgi:hypothetical protein
VRERVRVGGRGVRESRKVGSEGERESEKESEREKERMSE